MARADEGEIRIRTKHRLEGRESVEVILVDVAVDHSSPDPSILPLEPLLQRAAEVLWLIALLGEPELGENLNVLERCPWQKRRLEQPIAQIDHSRSCVEDDELVWKLERQARRVPADPDVAGREGPTNPPELHDDWKELIVLGHVCHDGLH